MWEIFAYHNSSALFGVFNAVAAIMGSGTFTGSLAAVAFCGFLAALLAYAFAPEKLHGWTWLGTVVLAYGVLIVPKVTVGIVDKTGGGPVLIVDNVPFGMAALGGLTSTIGNSLTEVFETAFQALPEPAAMPRELGYQRNGLMFGSRIIQETRRVSLPDPGTRADLVNFIGNCTVYDLSDGAISPQEYSTSDDIWSLMADTNPARFTTVSSPTGVTTDTCPAAYASIGARMAAAIAALTTRLALRLNPGLTPTDATAAVQTQITQAFLRSQIVDASRSASDIIRQNALINAVSDAGELGCQRLNDPSCMMMATGRAAAVAAQNAAWINGSKIAEQALPVVRNAAEALCYAIFPLVALLVFIGSGRTALTLLSSYAAVLISVQLWPPLFAVLNYMATVYGQTVQAAAAEVGAGDKALALQTADLIYSNSISGQAVVSYLIIGIPMLAYSMSKGLVNFGAQLFAGLAGLQSTVGNASSAAALGNAAIGNITMDQRTVTPVTSNPFVSREQTTNGNWITTTATGLQAIEFLRNSGAASNVVSVRASQGAVTEASRAADSARAEAVTASSERSAALAESISRARSLSHDTKSSRGEARSGFEEIGAGADRVHSIADQVSKTTNVSRSQVMQIGFQLAAGLGLGSAPIGARAGASGGSSHEAGLSSAELAVQSALSTEQLQEFQRYGDRISNDRTFLQAVASESREGNELVSRLALTTARAESTQATFNQRQSYAERLSAEYASGQVIAVDLAQLPAHAALLARYQQLASQYGPNGQQALQAAFSAEIGNYAMHPIKPSIGSAPPMSFSEVADHHSSILQEDAFAQGHVEQSRGSVTGTLSGPKNEVQEMSSLGARSSIGTSAVRSDADALVGGFDSRHGIVRGVDGTVSTSQSLAGKVTQQIGSEVDAALERSSASASASAARRQASQEDSPRERAVRETPEVPRMAPSVGRRRRP